ncbi:hypothetical protein L2E82_01057 [Cichorium intybus]|uniref:Uncharacterized protein n=1 Tax=Cichorium intybus TaxID=13427 RepID=A0ACB9GY86_CICIN|nr:hypothetical protein L2E82_01057 [Cichorium intybus]
MLKTNLLSFNDEMIEIFCEQFQLHVMETVKSVMDMSLQACWSNFMQRVNATLETLFNVPKVYCKNPTKPPCKGTRFKQKM